MVMTRNIHMKWAYCQLGENNDNAKKHVMANISYVAYRHTLAKKLMARFYSASGSILAIVMASLKLDKVTDYSHRAYYDLGRGMYGRIDEVEGGEKIGDRPIDGLVSFLRDFLRLSDQGAVVIENWIAKRTDPHMSLEARARPEVQAACLCTSRVAFFGDEVYHVLTPVDTDPELIEDTIREPWHQWFTGVCAADVTIPDSDVWSEGFLDELVNTTEHIFVPAFDDEGFLVWSPKIEVERENKAEIREK
jgi:hypothetical protein